ncbi:glycoside hydrolase family 3 protein [Gardnerella leopoldii]|uniref:glycoside hydrolase family 3 protein n=1 Tax=Gardnerella TaxID=2701 RepID=UPI000EEB499A|nr:glycoside hydrolase [Bifidobacteriaceae bacterium WP022]
MRKQRTRKLQSSPHYVDGRTMQYRSAQHHNQIASVVPRKRFAAILVAIIAIVLLTISMFAAVSVMRSHFFNVSSKTYVSKKTVNPADVAKKLEALKQARKRQARRGIDPNSSVVKNVLSKMSLEDKVAQMFIVKPEELAGTYGTVVSSGSQMQQSFNSIPVGGIMYSRENIQNPNQTQQMISGLQSISESRVSLPALVAVDEEGGTVARVSSNPQMGVNSSPNMRDIGATKKTRKAYKTGAYIGNYLSNLGFNVDFAPVADVITNPDNNLMIKRSFGSNASLVANMTDAFTDGLQEHHVFATYKHFPGHGSTFEDSHKGVTVSNQTPLALRKIDLVPFKDAVDTGVKFIMVSHVSYPKITGDDIPASMSEKIVTGLARKKLGYKGILISDSLGMGAISLRYSPGVAAITGIKAGIDILLSPANLRQAYYSVVNAVRQGNIPESRIDESVKRIIAVKLQIAQQLKSQNVKNSKITK